MKVQIDTNAKTLKIETDVNIAEFLDTIKKIFPDGKWKEYTLISNNTITWAPYPWYYTTASGTVDFDPNSITTTCFNMEVRN